MNKYQEAWNKSEKRKEAQRRYYASEKGRKKSLERAKKYHNPIKNAEWHASENGKKRMAQYNQTDKCRRIQRNYFFKKTYGIEIEDFEKMLEEQKGCCSSCSRIFDEQWKPNVDHDHKTGKVRALLCVNCNTILGHAHDDIDHLNKCIRFLEVHQRSSL